MAPRASHSYIHGHLKRISRTAQSAEEIEGLERRESADRVGVEPPPLRLAFEFRDPHVVRALGEPERGGKKVHEGGEVCWVWVYDVQKSSVACRGI